jgi:hypothetical protein
VFNPRLCEDLGAACKARVPGRYGAFVETLAARARGIDVAFLDGRGRQLVGSFSTAS